MKLPAGKKLVALTFDLCETPGEIAGYDGAIVDELRRTNSRATFFAGGKWLLTHSERAQQMLADSRFEIGSHGWAHRNVRMLTGTALADELNGPQLAFAAVRKQLAARQCATPAAMQSVAPQIRLFRFPFGACNAQSLSATAATGQLAIQWDVSTGDPDRNQSAAAIVGETMRHVRPGSIVLMHANGRGYNTSAAVPEIIRKLRAQGYELVTVSELLQSGEPEITQTCYDAKPGDTDKYDKFFSGLRAEARHAR
ncbi:MAG: polysaccharide deacetylase family protein [Proteobacteria bacterium]|nr:polysaccharide deacetylase family protein [Pseudomonadota bacterium]